MKTALRTPLPFLLLAALAAPSLSLAAEPAPGPVASEARPAEEGGKDAEAEVTTEQLGAWVEEVTWRLRDAMPVADQRALRMLTVSVAQQPGFIAEARHLPGAAPGHVHLQVSQLFVQVLDRLALRAAMLTLMPENYELTLAEWHGQLRRAALTGVIGHALGHYLVATAAGSPATATVNPQRSVEEAADLRCACAQLAVGRRSEGVLLWSRLLATLERQPELGEGLRQLGAAAWLKDHPQAAARATALARALTACPPPWALARSSAGLDDGDGGDGGGHQEAGPQHGGHLRP